ncbi:hypothetical protein ACWGI9_38290 [Streptomyces sp. NPDC054833]
MNRLGTVIGDNDGKGAYGDAVSATAAPNIGAYTAPAAISSPAPASRRGSMSSWVSSGAASSVSSSNARTGGYALTTQASSNNTNRNLTCLSPSTTYLLTGRAKVPNAGETLAFGATNHGGTETLTDVATTSYRRAAILFTTGSSSVGATVLLEEHGGHGHRLQSQ